MMMMINYIGCGGDGRGCGSRDGDRGDDGSAGDGDDGGGV